MQSAIFKVIRNSEVTAGMIKRLVFLLAAVVACSPKQHRTLPEWFLQPDTSATSRFGYGISLPGNDTAVATAQARTMAAALLALSRETRVTSMQTLREDSTGSSMEVSARFLTSMPEALPSISKLARLPGGITIVRVEESSPSAEATVPVELSWFESNNGTSDEISLVLVAGPERWEWTKRYNEYQFRPEPPAFSGSTKLDASKWKTQFYMKEGYLFATGDATFTNAQGAFPVAFLTAYAQSVSRLSHSVQSTMIGSAGMFIKNRSNKEVRTQSNTVLSGIQIRAVDVLAISTGDLLLEVHAGMPRPTDLP
jgi:hypothetical protein